ncbi:hypothetical protein DFR49_3346 [Hephaestia caeni]|uniref:Nucleotidyltransferase-like protein n=1 Tax=Hephaestia caeni TaxID=645617 RepID=A0A397NVP0_9SPHN|nr:hypothetical protein [Hephaestia caeni]RIA37461.1 hypothetical protein DFR49_3346 [Hephaestia caeni]
MGEWHHPEHYTAAAKGYAIEAMRAEIAVFIERVLPSLREAARSLGYALAVHGSLARDLDLIAVPWTDEAGSPDALIAAIADATKAQTGWGHLPSAGEFTPKPHGRTAVMMVASFNLQLDISITPRKETT